MSKKYKEHKCLREDCINITNNNKYCSNKCNGLDRKFSEEHKKNMSNNHWSTKGINPPFKGKKHTEETKNKIKINTAEAMKHLSAESLYNMKNKRGHLISEETRIKIGAANAISNKGKISQFKGKHHTEETKRIIGLIHRGKKLSISHRRILSLYNKGLVRTEENKLNISNGVKKYMSDPLVRYRIRISRRKQILPKIDTSIEVKIQNFLKQLGIEFLTHQYMKINHGYQCDILIPSMNLVIECDGNYWHKYPIGNDIDHIRTSELINKGFKVLRLWEFEIKKMSVDEFKNKIDEVSI